MTSYRVLVTRNDDFPIVDYRFLFCFASFKVQWPRFWLSLLLLLYLYWSIVVKPQIGCNNLSFFLKTRNFYSKKYHYLNQSKQTNKQNISMFCCWQKKTNGWISRWKTTNDTSQWLILIFSSLLLSLFFGLNFTIFNWKHCCFELRNTHIVKNLLFQNSDIRFTLMDLDSKKIVAYVTRNFISKVRAEVLESTHKLQKPNWNKFIHVL